MEEKSIKECSRNFMAVQDALDIFSGKWKIHVLAVLIYFKEARFKELQRIIGNISPKMLSKELKELEMNKLLTREVMDTRPVTVIYKITSYGETCNSVIIGLHDWGAQHRKKIMKKEEVLF